MKHLTVHCRLANSTAHDTLYEYITVEAKDGGDAQRKAIDMLSAKYPAVTVSGGPVRPATPEEIKAMPKAKAKPKPATLEDIVPVVPPVGHVDPVSGATKLKGGWWGMPDGTKQRGKDGGPPVVAVAPKPEQRGVPVHPVDAQLEGGVIEPETETADA